MTDLRVSIGDTNGDGRRHVVYRLGEAEYPDVIDLANGFQREQSMRRALEALGLPADNLPGLAAEVVRLAKEKDQGKDGKKKDRFPLVTCAVLDGQDYTPRAIIDDVLYAESPAVIGGIFKVCKSLLAIDAALSIATGRQFLGHFPVSDPLSVLYFTGEGGPSVAQEYGRRIAEARGCRLSDASNLRFCFNVPRLESMEDLEAVQRIHDDTAAEVMIFDNLMLALSGDDAGNVFKMGNVLGYVIRICGERGITPVFVHHFKRTRATADPFAPGELGDLTQAGAAEVAGQHALLTRREPFDPDQPGEHRLWLAIGGRVGHGGLWALDIHEGRRSDPGGRRWEVEVIEPREVRKTAQEQAQAAKVEKQQAKVAAETEVGRRAIVDCMRAFKAPATLTDIRDSLAIGHGKPFERAWASLLRDGSIAPAGEIKKANHQSYPAFSLVLTDA